MGSWWRCIKFVALKKIRIVEKGMRMYLFFVLLYVNYHVHMLCQDKTRAIIAAAEIWMNNVNLSLGSNIISLFGSKLLKKKYCLRDYESI